MAFVTRFAPSPTGLLHRGHAYSALLAFEAAQRADGHLILRIEDIDQTRCRPEFEQALFDDLAWLGVRWSGEVVRQSQRLSIYNQALEQLFERGVIYRCFRTRKEVLSLMQSAPHGPGEDPAGTVFTGAPLPPDEEAQRLEAGKPFAWRLSLTQARRQLGAAFDALDFYECDLADKGARIRRTAQTQASGDIILARKDIGVAYHLAVVVDDAAQGVTHVIRGEDLREATGVQRLLQVLLGLPAPLYHHHPLLLRPDGKRFAKRDQAETLQDLRRRGVSAEDLRRSLPLGDRDEHPRFMVNGEPLE